jgi:tRNA A-37 threonylcarbamoyl transferase component Bud32
VEPKRLRLAPGFSSENLRLALERHRACLLGGAGRVLKDDARTRVSEIALADGRAAIVKEYRPGGLARRLEDVVRPRSALREWRAAHELAQREVAAPAGWALVLPAPLAPRSAFVVLEAIAGAEPVNRFVLRRCAGADGRARRLRLADALAAYLRTLHARGVEHRDLKGSNLLVRERSDAFEFFLVDLAEVRFPRRAREGPRLEALAQLNASMPLAVGPGERLRFLARYAPDASRAERARLFRVIDRLTRARKCVWDPGYAGRELVDSPR